MRRKTNLPPALNKRSSALPVQSLTPTSRSTRAGISGNLGSHYASGGIEDRKDANNRVSETTANKWKGSVLQNIRKEPRWVPLLDLVWRPKKVPNRGLDPRPAQAGPPPVPEVPAAAIAADVDSMLEYISQYAPNSLYRDITVRSTSLNNVWEASRPQAR